MRRFREGLFTGLAIVLAGLVACGADPRTETNSGHVISEASTSPGDAAEAAGSTLVDTSATGASDGGGAVCGDGVAQPGEVCLGPFVQLDPFGQVDLSGFRIADVDRDSRSDLVHYQRILFQRGGGVFESAPVLGLSGPQTRVGDVHGDGLVDVISYSVATGELQVARGGKDNTLLSPVAAGIGELMDLSLLDVDSDGRDELIGLLDPFNGPVRIWSFGEMGQPVMAGDLPAQGFNLVGGDMDGDGHVDLALADWDVVQLWWGTGDGNFTMGPAVNQIGVSGVRAIDVEGDGKSELLMSFYHKQGPIVVSGVGLAWPARADTSEWRTSSYDLGADAVAVFPVSGDFDHDGAEDLVMIREGAARRVIEVLCTDVDSAVLVSCATMDFTLPVAALHTLHANGDSALDIVTAVDGGGVWRMLSEP